MDIEFAIEVFARGHAAGKSRTFPYESSRVGPLWVMRALLYPHVGYERIGKLFMFAATKPQTKSG